MFTSSSERSFAASLFDGSRRKDRARCRSARIALRSLSGIARRSRARCRTRRLRCWISAATRNWPQRRNKTTPTNKNVSRKAAIQRRENLKHSADELKVQLNEAKEALSEAFEELKKVELLDERDQMRERAETAAQEQAELDAIGLLRARNATV